MATVDKIKNDLVRTINLMKKNIVLYQKADSDKQEKYKKIAVKLTKKKKQLEAALENGLESLYADAELDLNELRIIIRNEIQKVIINEVDVFGAAPTTSTDTPELEDAFNDLERDIKRTDIDAPESEAIGLTLAGIALSAPEIIKLIGKFVNLLKKIPFLKKLSGDKLIAIGDKYHHKITGAFEYIIKKAGVKDAAKAKKFAGVLHHVVIAMLLVAGGVSMSGLVTKGSIKGATLKGALNAIKAKEIRSFLITSADALV